MKMAERANALSKAYLSEDGGGGGRFQMGRQQVPRVDVARTDAGDPASGAETAGWRNAPVAPFGRQGQRVRAVK